MFVNLFDQQMVVIVRSGEEGREQQCMRFRFVPTAFICGVDQVNCGAWFIFIQGPVTLQRARQQLNLGDIVRFDLRAGDGNSRALGAVVEVWAGEWRQRQMVRSGSSYASQSEFILTFGLGEAARLDGARVRWPDGAVSEFDDAALAGLVDHELRVHSAAGIVASTPLEGLGR